MEACGAVADELADAVAPGGVDLGGALAYAVDEGILIEALRVAALRHEVEVALLVVAVLQELGGRAEAPRIGQIGEAQQAPA